MLIAVCLWSVAPAWAQQRPLMTEDPETVGAGNLLFESGIDYARDVTFPTSGLVGNMWTVPTIGVSMGFSSIAEIQVDSSFHRGLTIIERRNGPLAGLVDETLDHTSAPDDLVIATKIRVAGETDGHPAIGLRFATTLPLASTRSGLGKGTTDFLASVLVARTIGTMRIVGNGGLAIVGNPTVGSEQSKLLAFGLSGARAMTSSTELVGEINGRVRFGGGSDTTTGAESRGLMRFGGRFTYGSMRVDSGAFLGLTARDPDVGFTIGLTWVLKGFTLP
jgi:hypothetical protein